MAPDFALTQEMACLNRLPPVVSPQPEKSGWHLLIGGDFKITRWYWDAAVAAWRGEPDAFEAETPLSLACEGFVYLKEE